MKWRRRDWKECALRWERIYYLRSEDHARAQAAVTQLTEQRDAARTVAVRLEQELAELQRMAGWVTADLLQMHAAEAIDLDEWPTASELVEWAGTVRQP